MTRDSRDATGSTDSGTTRRATLRATSLGLAAVTGVGTAAAAEAEPCVPKPELRDVQDSYASEGQVLDAVTGQPGLLDAIQDAGLYESEHLAVYVTASSVECEWAPRIDVLRRPTDGGVLTASIDPAAGESYALYNSGSAIEEIHTPTVDPCFLSCIAKSPCCSCEPVVCYDDPDFYGPPCPYSLGDPSADEVICTPYCWKCQCPDDRWDCIDVVRVDPVPVEMSEDWWPQQAE